MTGRRGRSAGGSATRARRTRLDGTVMGEAQVAGLLSRLTHEREEMLAEHDVLLRAAGSYIADRRARGRGLRLDDLVAALHIFVGHKARGRTNKPRLSLYATNPRETYHLPLGLLLLILDILEVNLVSFATRLEQVRAQYRHAQLGDPVGSAEDEERFAASEEEVLLAAWRRLRFDADARCDLLAYAERVADAAADAPVRAQVAAATDLNAAARARLAQIAARYADQYHPTAPNDYAATGD